MPNSLVIVWIHLVWSTKDRQPMIRKFFKGQLSTFIKKEALKKGIQIDTVNGVEDHIHVLLRLKSTQSLAEVTNWLKGRSSKWINDNFYRQGEFRWQQGYAAFSVNPDDVRKVRVYIYNQEKRHSRQSYDQELKDLNKRSELITVLGK